MPNVTLSLSEDLLRTGREYAHRHRTSLNALIRDLLEKSVSKTGSSASWLKECFKQMDRAKASSRGKKWSRKDLYRV